MSASVYWLPVVASPKGQRLDGQTGFATMLKLPRVFCGMDKKWLEGFKAGSPKDAADIDILIDAIEKYGEVRVWAEY